MTTDDKGEGYMTTLGRFSGAMPLDLRLGMLIHYGIALGTYVCMVKSPLPTLSTCSIMTSMMLLTNEYYTCYSSFFLSSFFLFAISLAYMIAHNNSSAASHSYFFYLMFIDFFSSGIGAESIVFAAALSQRSSLFKKSSFLMKQQPTHCNDVIRKSFLGGVNNMHPIYLHYITKSE